MALPEQDGSFPSAGPLTVTGIRRHGYATLVALANVSSLVGLLELARDDVLEYHGTTGGRRDVEAVAELLALPRLDDRAVVPLTLLRRFEVTLEDAALCAQDPVRRRRYASAALLVDQVVQAAAARV